jgi:DNA polymerase III gamma/tau subunit
VVEEDGPAAFALSDRAVASGTDLRIVCRELSRVVRDMMVLSVDPERAGDGELADDERERLVALGKRFSREDLMRAFDLLSKAEYELRGSSHPRYHFEMVLLRWMHLRKLVPLAELLGQTGAAAPASRGSGSAPAVSARARTSAAAAPAPAASVSRAAPPKAAPASGPAKGGALKDAFLAEIRAGKGFFYNTVVAQAQKIEVDGDRVLFTFLAAHRALREQFDQSRTWLESTAERVAGRAITVAAVQAEAESSNGQAGPVTGEDGKESAVATARDLKAEALSSEGVQALLDVFPAQIRDVEEL